MARTNQQAASIEEKLEQALTLKDEQPFDVPDNWLWTKLKVLYNFIDYRGKTPTKIAAGVPLITAKNVKMGYMDYSIEEFISQSEYSERQSRGISKKGDILITTEAPLGNVSLADLDEYSTGQRLITLQKHRSITGINNKFYFYYMLSEHFQNNIKSQKTGTTVAGIKAEKLKEIAVPLPPLPEQQRIVDHVESILEKLDNAKELIQNAIDGFEIRKAAVLFKAFSGELTAKWRERNNVDVDSWEECFLGDVCTVNPKRIDLKGIGDDLLVTFIPMAAVSDTKGAIVNPEVKSFGEVKKGYTNFSEGDVIFAKITPCMENGKAAVIGELINNIGFGSTEFHVLRCSNELDNRFLYYIVRNQSFRDEAKAVMTGAVGQQRVPKSFLEEYSLHLPTLNEQKEITRILDGLLEKEEKAKEACDVIEKIDLLRKTILARAFRGELGTNDPKEASMKELLKGYL